MEQRIQELAQRDVESLKRAGLTPTETLLHALSERATQEANESYMQEVHTTLEHNSKLIAHEEQKSIQRLRQKHTRVAYLVFAPLALVLAALAGYSFCHKLRLWESSTVLVQCWRWRYCASSGTGKFS
jgi:hypothetical protein